MSLKSNHNQSLLNGEPTYPNIQVPFHVPLVAPRAPISRYVLSHGSTVVFACVQTTASYQSVLKPSCPADLSWPGSYRPSCGMKTSLHVHFFSKSWPRFLQGIVRLGMFDDKLILILLFTTSNICSPDMEVLSLYQGSRKSISPAGLSCQFHTFM